MTSLITKIVVASTASTAVSTAVSPDILITTLITFGVSIITIVGGEAIKLVVAWLKDKREDIEKDDDKKEDN